MTAAEKFVELSEGEKRQVEGFETEVRKARARISGYKSCLDALGTVSEDVGARRRLEDRVEKEEGEIRRLERQIEESRERLSAFEEALKILAKKGKEPDLRAESMMAKVRDLIRQTGGPMTLVEIAKALNLDKKKKNSVRGSLASYARDERVFARGEGPETFTLIEFKNQSAKGGDGN
jgi:DNA repair exonuclease SbcCD ATPase subunit